ncbi:MAG TPA: tetratricopeptide repeat protein, partial [Planctomycetota bacterium]|nr:tetratricopeptide repeat protein [Planctomycetota bacterium]
ASGGAEASAEGDSAAAPPVGGLDADAAFDRIVAGDFASELEGEEFWQAVRDAGLMEEVLARFRERAEERPNDPEAQFDLGVAYVQALEGAAGPMQGMLAAKADEAFDAALALDEDHLEARAWKAISLSFWPPVFGKHNQAIQQFEILIEKQKNFPAEPQHASAYVLLGNLHLQQGAQDEALAVWKAGLALFPDDVELAQKIVEAEEP